MRKTQVSKQRPFLGVKMRPAEQLTPAAPLGVAVGEVELREDPGHQIDVKPPRLDLSSTLAFMQFRKVFRYHRGSYVKARPIVLLILFWCLGCLTLFDSCKVIYTDDGTFVSLPTDLWTGQNEVLFALAFLVVAAYWQLKLMYQYSLKLLVPMLSMSVVGQSIAILVEYFQQRDDEDSQIAGTIAFAYIIVSTFYIACVAIARVVFPCEPLHPRKPAWLLPLAA